MTAAAIGILLMIQDGLSGDTLFGNLTAFAAAVGFAGFTVSLRWGKMKICCPLFVMQDCLRYFSVRLQQCF